MTWNERDSAAAPVNEDKDRETPKLLHDGYGTF